MNAPPKTYKNIDWLQLWRSERAERSWQSKEAADWDRKASSFAERNDASPYTPLMLSRLPLQPHFSVLDAGCGPGTLALPLAGMVRQVTALDYSAGMLDLVRRRARQRGIANIATVHCAWEDDWAEHAIRPADLAIASRSLNVDDLPAAIAKLDAYASQYVFITDRIAPSPFDPGAFAALGRPFNSGPDYIYTLNFLYAMGIHANVEVLELEDRAGFADRDQALQSYRWMFKGLTAEEETRLGDYVDSLVIETRGDEILLRRPSPPRWAMIWWKKN